jgi:hypothetical protein
MASASLAAASSALDALGTTLETLWLSSGTPVAEDPQAAIDRINTRKITGATKYFLRDIHDRSVLISILQH